MPDYFSGKIKSKSNAFCNFKSFIVLTIVLFYRTRNDSQVINDLSEVYNVGTFVQIHELQDLGNKLRLVVMAHRRIRITGVLGDLEVPIKGKNEMATVFEGIIIFRV